MRILVVGKGGREHALVKALSESPSAPELYCFPGSDAIHELAGKVDAHDLPSLVGWMIANSVDLCVAGEESYLVKDEGLANACEAAGIPCWGPHKASAMLEASKEFAKEFMERHSIPTGGAKAGASLEQCRELIGGVHPVVLKFDGLAAGKGVAVCMDESQSEAFLDEVFTQKRFGEGRVLVEEFLTGPEVSVFAAIPDGDYQIFTPARDYKRIGEGDEGPNTGGMGAVASRNLVDAETLQRIETEIVAPTVAGLVADGLPYRGFLYFGLMLTPDGPKVIEYNCRFGDPECQAVMPLVEGDLATYCLSGAKGRLEKDIISFHEGWSVCVVLASPGYPETSTSGLSISGLDSANLIYHAGTKKNADGIWETAGGRVLAAVARGDDRLSAVTAAHAAADGITFDGALRRRDIGIMHFD